MILFAGVLFFEFSRTVFSMCTGGIVLFLIGLWAAWADLMRVRPLDKVLALGDLCFAMPLAVFGALLIFRRSGPLCHGSLIYALEIVFGHISWAWR